MAETINRRVTAHIEGDFVVFLIGMRINKVWKVGQWWPVAMAMPKMLQELSQKPETGLLGYESFFGFPLTMLVQYWRSFDHLEAYARNHDAAHWPAWVDFNKKIASNGDVGIWHETYLVKAGQYESVYNNMPAFGLGKATELVTATGRRESARSRVGTEAARVYDAANVEAVD